MKEKKEFMTVLANSIFLLICFAGIYTSFFMNSVNRSLWLDEAMLAVDFTQRSLGNLTDGVFSWNQSAPVGWLYIVKSLAVLFGHTEYIYRLFSVICYICILLLLYFLAKKLLGMKYPLALCAYVATMEVMLKYSNMFKPYISDGLFVLITVAVFGLYERKRINYIVLALVWALLIWFSNPVCFIAGGLIMSRLFFALVEKNKKNIKEMMVVGVLIVSSFVGNYFYWLREVAQRTEMQSFWENNRFPLIPTSREELELAQSLITGIYSSFNHMSGFFIVMTVISFVIAIRKRDKLILGLCGGIMLALFASAMSMFPISNRLWLFYYPLLSMIVFYTTEELAGRKEKKGYIIWVICCFVLILNNKGISNFLDAENIYIEKQETNQQIEYLKEKATSDESVYVYYYCKPGFWFKNGYDNEYLGDSEVPVIFGERLLFDTSEYMGDIRKIRNAKRCYIMMSMTYDEQIMRLSSILRWHGYVELLYNEYSTPIYYYCEDLKDSKTAVQMEVLWQGNHGDGTAGMLIGLHNTGESYLNHMYEEMHLIDKENNLMIDIPPNIKPGEYVKVGIRYPEGVEPNFTLESFYRELGSI